MKDLKRLLGRIDQLPTLPSVATQILAIVDDPKSSARELVFVISRDPAFTSTLLKRVNSAFFGLPRKISDIGQAVALLGTNFVKMTALGISVFTLFPESKRQGEPSREEFWNHSFAVGTLARKIAQQQPDLNAETAFAGGLLHDLGHLVLDSYDAVDLRLAYAIADVDEVPIVEAERRAIGCSHADVGAQLLEMWHFPPELVEPIRYHHRPEECGKHPQYARVIAVANQLCNIHGLRRGVERKEPPLGEATFNALYSTRQDLDGFVQAIVVAGQSEKGGMSFS